jgi:SHS2 domain-containing protein
MGTGWEILEHPADVGFRAYGRTPEELYANAALAMMTLACGPEGLEEREPRNIEVTGADHESLLFAWLADILAIQDAEHMFFRRAEVTEVASAAGGMLLRGRVFGEQYDSARHRAGTYIKAVTMHQLRVEKTAQGWQAQVYLDV